MTCQLLPLSRSVVLWAAILSAFWGNAVLQAQTETPVTPGANYTYTDTYTANATTYVQVRFHLQDSTKRYIDFGSWPSGTSRSVSVSFQAPATAVSAIGFHIIANAGSLTVANGAINPAGNPTGFLQGMVSINFDDGWRSTYNNAAPILDAAGLKATSYIITGRFSFSDYIGAAEVLNLQARGHEIGAHTRTHRDLTTLSTADAKTEIAGSLADLIGIGVQNVNTFSYPYGAYNAGVIQMVKDAGFIAARTTNSGYNAWNEDKFVLQRQNMGNTTTIAQVQSYIDSAVQNKTWLVLLFHHVDDTNTAYSVTPVFFQQIVQYLQQRNVPVVTMSQGVGLMQP